MRTSTELTTDIPRLRARPGFAMALTLGAIVVIGMLIAGVFFVSSQQTSASRNTTLQEQAFRVAEAGVAQSVSEWNRTTAAANPNPGDSWMWVPATAVPLPDMPGVAAPTVRITRLNNSLYHVMSRATVGGGANVESTRRIGQLIRMMSPTFNVLGALTVRGETKIGGSSEINGYDANPALWKCGATSDPLPGIAISDPSLVSTAGCTSTNCVSGDPAIEANASAAKDSTYFTFGDYSWADLVGMATLKMTLGNVKPERAFTATGACNQALQTNWGDPQRLVPAGKCEPYFPIIYFPGDATLNGGYGQGILMVEGDLSVQGGFEFFGPVIVRGRLKTAGTGGHFNGAVMAANVDLEQNSVLGDAIVSYSSCAISSALQGAGTAIPVRQRAWTEMF